ncbi:hypothetical protein TcWFU_005788 [Taenia crassiceps]|uniref:Uncharacterized protein n=1 Tax=Taenia crassiceps TaxID=6207 RepID=A0ABR4Q800_9CEST
MKAPTSPLPPQKNQDKKESAKHRSHTSLDLGRTARMATPSSLHHNAYVSLLQVFPCLTLEHQEPTATSPPRLPFIHLSSTLHPSSHRQLQKTQLQSPHPLTATLYYTSLRSTPYDAPPLLSTFTV